MGKRHNPRADRGGETPGQTNRVRIIGGEHRGRRLGFPSVPGLRPTPDLVRETLFNWLQPVLPGAVCLDLFAGSGALGLEAASRGAGRVTMVDSSAVVAAQIRENVKLLRLKQVRVEQADASSWLERTTPEPADIVFLDPPYDDGNLLEASCTLLERGGWLKSDARIYIEVEAGSPLATPGALWNQIRQKRSGKVCYSLYSNRRPG